MDSLLEDGYLVDQSVFLALERRLVDDFDGDMFLCGPVHSLVHLRECPPSNTIHTHMHEHAQERERERRKNKREF